MRKVFDTVVFASNSKISAQDKKRLNGLYDKFIQRKNKGFDFSAWRDSMNSFGWSNIEKYDELTIMNDTCFGPIHDFRSVYKEMKSRGVDFWGMTINVALKDLVVDGRGGFVFAPAHIQSYYITFDKRVFTTDIFKTFWNNIIDYSDVQDVIINYEIKLTDLLESNGYTYDAYYNAKNAWKKDVMTRKDVDTSAFSAGNMKKYNPGYTCTRPLWLLGEVQKYPFIKTKSIVMATKQIPGIRNYLIKNTNYPVQLIDSYIGSRFWELLKAKDKQTLDVLNSRTYRLGHIIATPWRGLKRIKNKA